MVHHVVQTRKLKLTGMVIVALLIAALSFITIQVAELFMMAKEGDTNAQVQFAFLNESIRNYSSAAKWYREAAEHGSVYGQFDLGNLYERGNGVEPDFAAAAFWYRKAAEQGNLAAEAVIAYDYYYGKGVKKNYGEAAHWYERAAEQGNLLAQFSIGCLYHTGTGVPKDDVESYKWFSLAAMKNDIEATADIKELEKSMSPSQITEAKRRAREWRPGDFNAPNKMPPSSTKGIEPGSGTPDVGAVRDTSSSE
jgi:hypothetical protein